MPPKLEKYRITDSVTGKSYVIMYGHDPTQDEMKQIIALKGQDEAAGKQAENASKLVTAPNLLKAGKDVGKAVLNPTSLATIGMGIVAPETIPLMGAMSAGQAIKSGYDYYKGGNPEDAGSAVRNAVGAGLMFAPSPTLGRSLNSGTPFEAGESNIQSPNLIPENASPTPQGPRLLMSRNPQPIRGQGFTVNAPKVIRPTTEGVYEVPEVKPLTSQSTKLDYGGGEGSRLVTKPTGFKTVKSGETIKESTPNEKTANQTEQTPTEEPVKKEEQKVQDKTPEVNQKQEVKTPETKAPESKPIENKWLKQTDTDLLKTMRPGSKGQLADEIDQVLQERGEVPEVKGKGLDTDKFNTYNQYLNDLASHGRTIGHLVLRDAAQMGKDAGLDQETITNDLIDNLHPDVANGVNKANNAANKVFNPPEEE